MRTHIDWLTFTMTMRYGSKRADSSDLAEQYAIAVEETFLHTFGAKLVADAFGGKWEKNERSRAPYTDAWKSERFATTLFASPSLPHCCVEISGAGCEALIRKSLLAVVLNAIHERVTRIDIACDIETDTRPEKFVSAVNHKRMTASGFQKSASGETCYVGSQKSDRYARVYRYNEPHPRAHLLRVEHVFRREYAKMVANACVAGDMSAVANSSAAAFGWAHTVWDTGSNDLADVSITSAERNAGKTVFWLATTVSQSFRKCVENGTIRDAEAFINRYFR